MNDSLDATHLSLTETHPNLVDILKQVDTSRPIILHQNGKEFAALISIEALHLFERLIEQEEDRIDVEELSKILVEIKEQGTVPWEDIKARLRL